MDAGFLIDYCLTKKGAYVDFPFGDDTMLVKAEGHYFASFFTLNGRQTTTIKCEAEDGRVLKETCRGIAQKAWHCPAVQQPYNLTVDIEAVSDERLLRLMIDASYAYNLKKMTKKERALLENA